MSNTEHDKAVQKHRLEKLVKLRAELISTMAEVEGTHCQDREIRQIDRNIEKMRQL